MTLIDTDIYMLPTPKWMVRPKKRGITEEDKVGLEAEKKRTKLDHPPPTSVSPSTKVEEVQEKGAVPFGTARYLRRLD